jgi:hypothetical protein
MYYLVDGTQFGLSYSELREDYHRYRTMSDEEFVKPETLLNAMHFCCVVAYFKELGNEATVSDKGVIHELIHLCLGQNTRSLREIREQFAVVMELA